MKNAQKIVGLIPAGGRASRLNPLPFSKELFPVGFHATDKGLRPKVVSHYLLEKMRHAKITTAYIILREGKWDIPSYFGDGKLLDMHLAYLMMDLPFGVPFTLDQAYPFIKDSMVALGFPDMIFHPDDAFGELRLRLEESEAEVVLGLFPAHNPSKTDMVELDERGRVRRIHIKPHCTELLYAWEIAVWTPVFTEFLHEYVLSLREKYKKRRTDSGEQEELHVGNVFQAAIKNRMRVDSVLFQDGSCLDIGTPEDLISAIHRATLDKANRSVKI
ncbi:MAG: dTDP-glucose pyrophosphorylase [Nitrospiraceae bacterium]|nr:MAG: dTDP-glucose pyrophosphorylase [Nitrospiraceae bacterium]